MTLKISVKTRLPQLTKLEKELTDKALSESLFKTGEWTRGQVLKNWNNSRGASGDPLKPLSESYREAKTGDGVKVNGAYRKGQGKPDFLLTGDLQRSLFTDRIGTNEIEVTVRAKEKGKAQGNANIRPNMFDVDKKFAGRIRDTFRRIITKKFRG